MKSEMKNLKDIPRIKLTEYPTPMTNASALAKEIGLSKLLIKRDDLIGFAGGGTKVRKLEYDLPEILENDYDVVLAAGGIQSNHARILSAAAKKFNIVTKLVLGGPKATAYNGNLLIDILFGAEIKFLVDDDDNDHLTAAMNEWAEELKRKGMRPYISPIGGSTPRGSIGCINAIGEIADQLTTGEKVQIVLPVGSCGTYAGFVLGSKLLMPNARIIGISVSRTSEAIKKRSLEIIEDCCKLLNINYDANDYKLEPYDQYFDEYGISTKSGKDALLKCANTEGILFDPIYTAKAMAGLIDLADRGILNKEITTIFLHTGGLPMLFSFEKTLLKYNYSKHPS